MTKKAVFMVAVILVASFGLHAQSSQNLVQYVNPFIGTGAANTSSLSGSNFPGATTPFGFVQLSPDTQESPDDPASGYDYNDKTIVGFSHTHLSGTGVSDLFDFLFMPTTGKIYTKPGDAKNPETGYRSRFSHSEESAKTGYYQVKLLDYNINAELTATEHAGFHRYTFPQGSDAHVIIDLNHSLNKKRPYWVCKIIDAQIRQINDRTLEGFRIITGWAQMRRVYFYAEFSKPIISNEMVNGNHVYNNNSIVNGTNVRAALNFDTKDATPLLIMGLSETSIANAKENLNAEISGWNFNAVVKEAQAKWEKELEKINVDGTKEQKQIFYTGLYHAFTQPNNIADVNGDYMGADYSTYKAKDKTNYSTFSLWDTYRAANPLYTIIQPQKTAAFIRSMMRQYETYGYLPIWQLWGEENYCMIGNHAIPVIVDAALKGIKGFDVNEAYKAIKASSTVSHPGSPFDLWTRYHYMPENLQSQSVSITLEMSFDDWCVAQLAKKLGKTADYNEFMQRSENYKNLFDKSTGFFRAKNSNGEWLSPFDPLDYGGNGGSPYTEGNAWQYLWYVPQNVPELINLLGGKEAFVNKLDSFFTIKNLPKDVNGNASGFIGQYAHGNEPSHHITYLYDFAGQPWKTQFYVAEVLNTLYNNSSSGYSGNEDCGQMSSWYIFSSMGFYPVNPASGIYEIGSPVLKQASIHLSNGKTFTVNTKNAGKENVYIQSVTLDGKPYNKTFIKQSDIESGSTLDFTMGATPNKNWGVSK
ncbi:MAG TPA: GH92 family glycosyl hydrolase [Hanamia sp.]